MKEIWDEVIEPTLGFLSFLALGFMLLFFGGCVIAGQTEGEYAAENACDIFVDVAEDGGVAVLDNGNCGEIRTSRPAKAAADGGSSDGGDGGDGS